MPSSVISNFIDLLTSDCYRHDQSLGKTLPPREIIQWCKGSLRTMENANKDPNISITGCTSRLTDTAKCLEKKQKGLQTLSSLIATDFKELFNKSVSERIKGPIDEYKDLAFRLKAMSKKIKNKELLSQYNLDGDYMDGTWKLPKDFPRSNQ